jgi:S1-C subfamily serine protease
MAANVSAAASSTPVSLGLLAEGGGPNGGYVVTKVERFGSAGKAGIQLGDELLALNGKLRTPEETTAILSQLSPGAVITLTLLRKGQRMEVPVKLMAYKPLKLDLDDIDDVLERKIAPAA